MATPLLTLFRLDAQPAIPAANISSNTSKRTLRTSDEGTARSMGPISKSADIVQGDSRLTSHTVRFANETDLDAMLDILVDVAGEGCWIATELPIDRSERRDRLLTTLKRTNARMFVAVDGDSIVGHLGVSSRWPGLLEFGMVVAADQRGKGVGSGLLTACIVWGGEIGAYKLVLEVFPHNHGARALYRKFGFIEEAYFCKHLRRANGELWDVIAMGLVLERAGCKECQQ